MSPIDHVLRCIHKDTGFYHFAHDQYTRSGSRIGMDRSERSRFELRETAHAEAWAMEHRSKIEMLANVQPILEPERVYTGSVPVTIPMKENFMVALLLLRSKHHEHINRAKDLLERLFGFFSDGGFPRALHEYPTPAHHLLQLDMLTTLVLIRQDFPIFGAPFAKRLEDVISRLFDLVRGYVREGSKSSFLVDILEVIDGRRDESTLEWCQEDIHDLRFLTLLALLLERMKEKGLLLFQRAFSILAPFYHREWNKDRFYGFGILYAKNECIPSLFHYYFALKYGAPYPLSFVDPFYLDLAFLEPQYCKEIPEIRLEKETFPGLDIKATVMDPKSHERQGFFPIRLITPHSSPVISLTRGKMVSCTIEKQRVTALFESNDDVSEDQQFIQFFIEGNAPNFAVVEEKTGAKAAYFRPNENIVLSFDTARIRLLADGHSSWSLLRGNRSGQLEKKTAEGAIGFDWMLVSHAPNEKRPKQLTLCFEVLS